MRRSWIIPLFVALSIPRVVAGQDAPPSPGDRVRIATVDGETLVGRWEAATHDTVRLTIGDVSTAVPLHGVDRLERSTGIERSFKPERIILLAAGFGVAGGFLGKAVGPCESDEFLGCMFSPTTEEGAMQFGAGLGVALGLVIGFAVGAQESDDWRPVPGFGVDRGSLELHPFVGPRSGLTVSFRPGRR